MNSKASGRSALIVATGLFVCLAGPLSVTTGAKATTGVKSEGVATKYAKHGTRHWKYAHRRSAKIAFRSSTSARKAAAIDVDDDDKDLPPIPASVANANAQLASADPTLASARAMTARANNIVQAASSTESQVVSADQLNEIDRALPMANLVVASAETPAAAPAPVAPTPVRASMSTDRSTWEQTSLIGKIFIAFGALLTMASAARMFMA